MVGIFVANPIYPCGNSGLTGGSDGLSHVFDPGWSRRCGQRRGFQECSSRRSAALGSGPVLAHGNRENISRVSSDARNRYPGRKDRRARIRTEKRSPGSSTRSRLKTPLDPESGTAPGSTRASVVRRSQHCWGYGGDRSPAAASPGYGSGPCRPRTGSDSSRLQARSVCLKISRIHPSRFPSRFCLR